MLMSAVFCLLLDVIFGLMANKYPAGLYICIEHIQLLAVLPVAGSYFTAGAHGLFRMMRHALLGFDFIDFWSLFNVSMNYRQDNQVLDYLGLVSNSAVVNLLGFASFCACVLVVDMLVFRMLRLLCCE